MNLRHLEVFRHVMQTGSVRGAATLLRVSDAAASKLLSTAERRMGLVLFERKGGRLVPTPEAHRLYEDVEQLWHRVERIESLTRSLAQPTGGTLTMAISPSLGVTVVPKAAADLRVDLPELTINVELLTPRLLMQSVVEGVADIGVSFNPQQHPSVEVIDCLPCGLVCVMPSTHVLAAKSTLSVIDLVGHPVVSFPLALDYGLSDEALFGSHSEEVSRRVNVRSGQTACWFALAGGGLAIVDAASVAGGAFPGLASRAYECNGKIEVFVLKRRDRPLSRPATCFVDEFRRSWLGLSGPY
jgi:DNA-binding transcriptional LysR family regulator